MWDESENDTMGPEENIDSPDNDIGDDLVIEDADNDMDVELNNDDLE